MHALALPISLRVVSGAHSMCTSHSRHQRPPEFRSEAGVTVTDDFLWHAMTSDNGPQKDVSKLLSGHHQRTGNVDGILGEAANKSENCIMASISKGKVSNEVGGHLLEAVCWRW